MYPAAFEYYAPTSVSDALSLLAKNSDAKIIAGGHSLLPLMKLRLAQPPVLIDIGKINDLRGIHDMGDKISIGALTTHHDIEHSGLLRSASPLVPEVASHIGDRQVRNRGTIGGSLAHADPAADFPAAMMALGATIEAQGSNSKRTINAADLFTGLMQTSLNASEMITSIQVPKTNAAGNGVAYAKFAHPASRYAIVGVAVWVNIQNDQVQDIRIGVTGAGEHAVRATKTEDALKGKPLTDEALADAAKMAADGIKTLGDMYASADYRAHLVNALTAQALDVAHRRAHGMM
ncbi:MAG TPA: xanthine dehydrogenase family protein subunit M [Anaerolineae bacterium]|nr:xanthine dehydrogenase family protein subunit M [Anaerolineae bacterium]